MCGNDRRICTERRTRRRRRRRRRRGRRGDRALIALYKSVASKLGNLRTTEVSKPLGANAPKCTGLDGV
jgi:hypothetical protein